MEAVVNLLALAAPPVTVPVTLPTMSPLNCTACTVCQRLSDEPRLNVCVALGSMEPVELVPAILTSPPTQSFLAIPTPPDIFTDPVPMLVLSVVP